MTNHGPSTYGDEIAEVYDDLYEAYDPAAISTLVELSAHGPVLELGIGTGRLAIPLAMRGVPVHGVDASLAMVQRLRAKPGGAEIPVTIADFSTVALADRFQLVFVAFNTIFTLPSQEEQVRCFQSVASLLREGGLFVIEAFVPDLGRFERGQRLAVWRIERDAVWLEASRHAGDTQVVDSQLVRLSGAGVRLFPLRIRYAWPAELDLMARTAGLRLRERWSGWRKQPFSADSGSHVSVYERSGPAVSV